MDRSQEKGLELPIEVLIVLAINVVVVSYRPNLVTSGIGKAAYRGGA
jgi:hypothetical protein